MIILENVNPILQGGSSRTPGGIPCMRPQWTLRLRHPLNFAVNVDIRDPVNIKTAKILTQIKPPHRLGYQLGLVADPVIEAIVRQEFEDGLRTGVLHRACWCHCW